MALDLVGFLGVDLNNNKVMECETRICVEFTHIREDFFVTLLQAYGRGC